MGLLLSLCETIAELELAPRWLQWLVVFVVRLFKWCLQCGGVYPKPDLAEDVEAACFCMLLLMAYMVVL